MASYLRRAVSLHKRRFQEDGYDLDLAYITSRVIAMAFPAEGGEGFYRNPMAEVRRFLEQYHGCRCKVYNLCSEKSYQVEKLGTPHAAYPFDDHQVPRLSMIRDFCEDATAWLLQHPQHVVAVHCKAGKGRTGLMICALLMHINARAPDVMTAMCVPPGKVTADDVMALYGARRTHDGNGVSIASQRRYVRYHARLLDAGCSMPVESAARLQEIRIGGLPPGGMRHCELLLTCRPTTGQNRSLRFELPAASTGSAAGCCISTNPDVPSEPSSPVGPHLSCQDGLLSIDLPSPAAPATAAGAAATAAAADPSAYVLEGDVRVQLLRRGTQLFSAWFNCAFMLQDGGQLCLTREDLDKVDRSLPDNVTMTIRCAAVPLPDALQPRAPICLKLPSSFDASVAPQGGPTGGFRYGGDLFSPGARAAATLGRNTGPVAVAIELQPARSLRHSVSAADVAHRLLNSSATGDDEGCCSSSSNVTDEAAYGSSSASSPRNGRPLARARGSSDRSTSSSSCCDVHVIPAGCLSSGGDGDSLAWEGRGLSCKMLLLREGQAADYSSGEGHRCADRAPATWQGLTTAWQRSWYNTVE